MRYLSCSRLYSIFPGRSGVKILPVLAIIAILSFSGVLVSAGTDNKIFSSSFDMSGTITDVITPSNIIVGKENINLESVDSSGLSSAAHAYLMRDLKEWLIGKDVFVKGNSVYFNLNGAYNSVSINEMIQKEVMDLWYEQQYYRCYYYGRCYQVSSVDR